jgi:hypothetical protein
MNFTIVLGLLVSILGYSWATLQVLSPSSVEGSYLAPKYKWMGLKSHNWTITGTLAEMSEDYGCDVHDTNLAGKIALVTKDGKT